MATTTRPRISADFRRWNTRERALTGIAKAIAERGYEAAAVTDIVKACRMGRDTFYKCFGGKEEAALSLVAALDLEIEKLSEAHSLDVLLIEVAASYRAGEAERAREYLLYAARTIEFFAREELSRCPRCPPSDELRGTLPGGRHGLPADFVLANQRRRLLEGTAMAIVDRGWLAVSISDVVSRAALSRRTFYEQFSTLDALAATMVSEALTTDLLNGFSPRSGLYAVAVEILADRLVGGDPRTSLLANKALRAISVFTTAFEEREDREWVCAKRAGEPDPANEPMGA